MGGAFNLAGHRITWAEFMRILDAGQVAWVPVEVLQRSAVTFPELPLFRAEHGPRAALMDVSSARAQAAGLTLTDPAVTARDVAAWGRRVEGPLALTPGREAQRLQAAQLTAP